MIARLGFSVATDVQPDILIIDEILSVGDEEFQQKSAARIKTFGQNGTTIFLVSHSLDTVQTMCTRAAWLSHGELKSVGDARKVVNPIKTIPPPDNLALIITELPEDSIMNFIHLDSELSSSSSENSMPVVSILIPFINCREMTKPCLQSLLSHTNGIAYEIILVDDGSDEPLDFSWNTSPSPIRIIRNQVRKNFSANNNQAAALARGQFLCLLNNDTLVTPGWLKPMVDILRLNPDIGVLGNKQLFPGTEKLHHCGMAFDDNGLPWHLHPHTDPSLPAVNYQRDLQIVTFACVLIPTPVYRELGGLG